MTKVLVLALALLAAVACNDNNQESRKLTGQLLDTQVKLDAAYQNIEAMERDVFEHRRTNEYLKQQLGVLRADTCLFGVFVPHVGIVIPYGELAREPVPPDMQVLFLCGRGLSYLSSPGDLPVWNQPDDIKEPIASDASFVTRCVWYLLWGYSGPVWYLHCFEVGLN